MTFNTAEEWEYDMNQTIAHLLLLFAPLLALGGCAMTGFNVKAQHPSGIAFDHGDGPFHNPPNPIGADYQWGVDRNPGDLAPETSQGGALARDVHPMVDSRRLTAWATLLLYNDEPKGMTLLENERRNLAILKSASLLFAEADSTWRNEAEVVRRAIEARPENRQAFNAFVRAMRASVEGSAIFNGKTNQMAQMDSLKYAVPLNPTSIRETYGTLPVQSPDYCHNALLSAYQRDRDDERIQAIRYANTMMERWPHSQFLAGSTYLAGWSVLFADTEHRAAAILGDHLSWERYIESLVTASYYFDVAARSEMTDAFWKSAANKTYGLVNEGFENSQALNLYLAAQRLTRISYLNTQDERALMEAVKIMEALEATYPEWARQFGVVTDKKETICAIALQGTRREESRKLFGE